MSATSVDSLVRGLGAALIERGIDRACADTHWLQNILADYSPQTPALNRVAALAAREGVPGWLHGASPGMVDAVVAQAVSRLATAHAIEAGAAHDAVSAWARALGVVYSGSRPTSAPVPSAGGERLARKIQKYLDLADAAEDAGRWQEAAEAYNDVLALDPTHEDALRFRIVAQRRLGIVVLTTPLAPPAPTAISGPSWRAGWMTDCGEDAFGNWAAVSIAGVEHRFRYCPPGKFMMGSPSSETGRFDNEGPQREVRLAQGFWIGEVPVTQNQWEAVAGKNPSRFGGPDLPVENVSWRDCKTWIRQASARAGGRGLRLPTEAEWEYACRAGTTGAMYRGRNNAATLNTIAWCRENSHGKTHPVKKKKPNHWGLYDMLGNVWEWTEDCWTDSHFGGAADGTACRSNDCSRRVIRGGSWGRGPGNARSALRDWEAADNRLGYLGFRVARTF